MSHPEFKLMIVGRRRAGTSLAEHHHHILNVHGALVAKYIALDPIHAPKRYAQNRVVDGSFRQGGPTGDPFALNRDFVTQIWFNAPAEAMNSVQRPFYLEQLRPDEDRFVDQASVVKLAVRERAVAAPPKRAGGIKLFSFFTKSPAVDAPRFLQAWRDCSEAFANSEAGRRCLGQVQNEVLDRPGDTAWVDAVDEYWVADLAAAHTLALAVQSSMLAPLVAAGLVSGTSHFTLMAEEAVLYQGITP
jgi:hypothetical protein